MTDTKIHPTTYYRVFKYTVYILLALNVLFFLREDYLASAETFVEGVNWGNLVQAYAQTIDTFSWVVLLLLFELETAVISDDKLNGGLKWVLLGIRATCYFFIVYAFYGYCLKYGLVTNFQSFSVANLCDLVGGNFSYIHDLDEYPPLDSSSCAAMASEPLVRIEGTDIIATQSALDAAIKLAIVEIVNAADWLIIVALLELEVFLQLRNSLTKRSMMVIKSVKSVLYAILFACAIYWGIEGDFLDFWDAFLWLVAFIFIEMNIFEWNAETQEDLATPLHGAT